MSDHTAVRRPISRRRLLGIGIAAVTGLALACGPESIERSAGMASGRWQGGGGGADVAVGRLTARPVPPSEASVGGASAGEASVGEASAREASAREASAREAPATGLTPLGLGGDRDGLLYLPAAYSPERPRPLVLMLHGAGGSASRGLWPFQEHADAEGLILLAVDSRGSTWDVIRGGFGPDVAFIDRALRYAFSRCAVDPARVAVGGFSDGASYALSLGLTNGDLFRRIVAFSPGFAAPADEVGTPLVYVSHGVGDTVLPIDRCSRRIVPQLQRAGYDVRYREFDGPHTVPPEVALEALAWLAGAS